MDNEDYLREKAERAKEDKEYIDMDDTKVFTFSPVATRNYRWDPQPDITAHELALCMPLFVAAVNPFSDPPGMIDALPDGARRHWQLV